MTDRQTVEKNKKDFPPGSKEAIENGCTCSPKENNHGKGYNNRIYLWLVNSECPLHWCESDTFNKKKKNTF